MAFAIEEVRPAIQADGGDVALVGIEGATVASASTAPARGARWQTPPWRISSPNGSSSTPREITRASLAGVINNPTRHRAGGSFRIPEFRIQN